LAGTASRSTVLPLLEGRRVRLLDALHRAGRRDQHLDAALRVPEGRLRPQRGGQERPRRRLCVLGLSYKENIDDDRESPSYEIIELLEEAGAHVEYCDPFFPAARAGRKHDVKLTSVPCTAEEFRKYDALVVSTAHRQFSDPALYAGVGLVIDTRNIVKPAPAGPRRVVKA